jgi:hypothetical protein
MIHGTCCGKNFNCVDIYKILSWSIQGECPWCRHRDELTQSQLFGVCYLSGNGWHAPELRNLGTPGIGPNLVNPAFIECSTRPLAQLDHLDDTGRSWRTSPIIEYAAIDFLDNLDVPPQPPTPWPGLPTVPPSPTATKRLQLSCRCNNCA